MRKLTSKLRETEQEERCPWHKKCEETKLKAGSFGTRLNGKKQSNKEKKACISKRCQEKKGLTIEYFIIEKKNTY